MMKESISLLFFTLIFHQHMKGNIFMDKYIMSCCKLVLLNYDILIVMEFWRNKNLITRKNY